MTKVSCVQLQPRVGHPEENRELTVTAVARAVSLGAEVVVLPELATSGYVFEDRDEARRAAITAGDRVFARWSEYARLGSALVIGGFCELGPDGSLFNSAAVVDGNGMVAVYRKVHLWNREKRIFAPGVDPPPVIETSIGTLGVLICYDLEFPEMTRHLGLAGADLVAVPTNWPRNHRPCFAPPSEVAAASAAAASNGIFIACCDRAGVERGQEWEEATVILDPRGQLVSAHDAGGCVTAEVDLRRARDKRLTEDADLFGDRRPDVYARLRR